jgi:hypothetical protein
MNMSARKEETPKSRTKKEDASSKRVKIPVKELFRKISEKVDSPEIRRVAPEEVKALRANLDGAIEQIEAINIKLERQAKSPR